MLFFVYVNIKIKIDMHIYYVLYNLKFNCHLILKTFSIKSKRLQIKNKPQNLIQIV